MTRFSGEGEDPGYANAGDLWWANVRRAVRGRKGQAALRELLDELEAMPQKRLIEGHLVKEGDVCAVGAYVVRKRCEATGKTRTEILAELNREHATCACYHGWASHGPDGGRPCASCAETVARASAEAAAGKPWRWDPKACPGFTWPEYDDSGEDEWTTVEAGREAGLSQAIAYRLAYLNDEDLAEITPEQRYERVVAWLRKQLQPEAVPA